MQTLLRAASALALLATPALAGQEQHPTEQPSLVLSSRTMLDGGSNGELRFTSLPHAVTLAQGASAAGGSSERLPEPVRAGLPSAARTASAPWGRGRPAERESIRHGRALTRAPGSVAGVPDRLAQLQAGLADMQAALHPTLA